MEHLIQFTVNIDDDKITEGVRAAATSDPTQPIQRWSSCREPMKKRSHC